MLLSKMNSLDWLTPWLKQYFVKLFRSNSLDKIISIWTNNVENNLKMLMLYNSVTNVLGVQISTWMLLSNTEHKKHAKEDKKIGFHLHKECKTCNSTYC